MDCPKCTFYTWSKLELSKSDITCYWLVKQNQSPTLIVNPTHFPTKTIQNESFENVITSLKFHFANTNTFNYKVDNITNLIINIVWSMDWRSEWRKHCNVPNLSTTANLITRLFQINAFKTCVWPFSCHMSWTHMATDVSGGMPHETFLWRLATTVYWCFRVQSDNCQWCQILWYLNHCMHSYCWDISGTMIKDVWVRLNRGGQARQTGEYSGLKHNWTIHCCISRDGYPLSIQGWVSIEHPGMAIHWASRSRYPSSIQVWLSIEHPRIGIHWASRYGYPLSIQVRLSIEHPGLHIPRAFLGAYPSSIQGWVSIEYPGLNIHRVSRRV